MKKGIFFIALAAICGSMLLCAPVKSEAKKISSLSAAKKMAKMKVKKAVITEAGTDYDKGTLVYEIELFKGSREYNLKYRASDGKLLEYQWELKSAAYSRAKKVSETKIRKKAASKVKKAKILSVLLDADDDDYEYKVIMKKGTKKYKLVYHAGNGKLLEYGWEENVKQAKKASNIGLKKAKAIAAKKVPGGRVVKAEFDHDDGLPVYEIEMKKDWLEYEIKIHAQTGKILEFDVDTD